MTGSRRALISVTDKTGVVEFAAGLVQQGYEILSTGGTARALREGGVAVREVAEVTGMPEVLGGRVKTLHPLILGGILYRRGRGEDERDVERQGLVPIDLVAVNLYAFEATSSRGGVRDEEVIEAIDIGGPTLIRSAAKNWAHVAVVTSPAQYGEVLAALASGGLDDAARRRLAEQAFQHTAAYDRAIADWFEGAGRSGPGAAGEEEESPFPERVTLSLSKHQALRYGENPHQAAAFYRLAGEADFGVAACRQLHGKALSFNNLIDADIALALPSEFEQPCVAILKHTTPSGVAVSGSLAG
ncbi:MAG TPA: bifunctional phosphoribosylaminoimidazolecarboxamide formyltransferase/IMP cyclohydrolase, partial [Bacteroidetes bacterium]|nr:bifunctional phosphoribosylaminoimidazolecarboxamide formyltransferase/IMP cyclohydrolase [Bacteroidota bacterium]